LPGCVLRLSPHRAGATPRTREPWKPGPASRAGGRDRGSPGQRLTKSEVNEVAVDGGAGPIAPARFLASASGLMQRAEVHRPARPRVARAHGNGQRRSGTGQVSTAARGAEGVFRCARFHYFGQCHLSARRTVPRPRTIAGRCEAIWTRKER